MLIKKETEYAILGLIALTKKRKEYFDIKKLSESENISQALLSKVFQRLANARIVESKLGPNGGFRLIKEARDITLFEIIEAVQKEGQFLHCYAGSAPYCKKTTCPLKKTIEKIEETTNALLKSTSIQSLIDN